MGYTLMLEGPKKLGFEQYKEQDLLPNEVRIKTLYSGISAGTELTAYRGSNPYLHRQWDEEQRMFTSAESSWSYPMPAIGYEEVGEIIEVGSNVTKLSIGDCIFGVWGHKSSHIAKEEWAVKRQMPKNLEAINGIYSQIGAIALNAILDANIRLGETVAIFGQGVPGLMVTQLAKASGATVIAVDREDNRLKKSIECGATHVINSANIDAGTAIKELTDGRGADVSIEISGAYGALHDAIRSTAYNSRVVVSGFFQGDGIGLRLGEEFHHNRVELICSQISGTNKNLGERWDRSRLDNTIMKLMADKVIDFKSLISHTFPAQDAQDAFNLLDKNANDTLQVVLSYDDK